MSTELGLVECTFLPSYRRVWGLQKDPIWRLWVGWRSFLEASSGQAEEGDGEGVGDSVNPPSQASPGLHDYGECSRKARVMFTSGQEAW